MSVKIPSIYQVKIALKGARPPIWRKLETPSNTPMPKMHEIIQTVMEWEDMHMHEFMTRENCYGPKIASEMGLNDIVDYEKFVLSNFLKNEKDKILYKYDFGDSWIHEITLMRIMEVDPKKSYPVCIGGKRATPPEDVGGLHGYYYFLEVINDPKHPEYEELNDWVSDDFDPESFDKDNVNGLLRYWYD